MTGLAAAAILVEGKDDRRFVWQYLQYLGFGNLLFDGEPKSPGAAGNIIIRETNGIGALTGKKISPDIIQDTSNSGKVLIVFDANADVQKRRKKLQNAAAKIKAKTDADTQLFLLPDDKSTGELENLLLRIFRDPKTGGVGGCFDNYETCLQGRDFQPPSPKGKIYAYCEAHGAEPRGHKRNYLDRERWDLEHTELLPLRDFLRNNLSSPAGEKA